MKTTLVNTLEEMENVMALYDQIADAVEELDNNGALTTGSGQRKLIAALAKMFNLDAVETQREVANRHLCRKYAKVAADHIIEEISWGRLCQPSEQQEFADSKAREQKLNKEMFYAEVKRNLDLYFKEYEDALVQSNRERKKRGMSPIFF